MKRYTMEITYGDDNTLRAKHQSDDLEYIYRKYKEFFYIGGEPTTRLLDYNTTITDHSDGKQYCGYDFHKDGKVYLFKVSEL